MSARLHGIDFETLMVAMLHEVSKRLPTERYWTHLDVVFRMNEGEVTCYPGNDCARMNVYRVIISVTLQHIEEVLSELFEQNEDAFNAKCREFENELRTATEVAMRTVPLSHQFDYVHFGDADDNPREWLRLDWLRV